MPKFNVKDLVKLMKRAKEDEQPFVFFTGAGCSISAGIPSANQFIHEIEKEYSYRIPKINSSDLEVEGINRYGLYMEALNASDRRKLIGKYVAESTINWAHIALAAMLERGYIKRVNTFNFDNIMVRSCGLLGFYPAVYDLTSANPSLHDLIVDPAIIYLHGQSHGFTQHNTQKDTEEQAKIIDPYITSTLTRSPTLFIGYSGEADAFFPIIQKKYMDEHDLIWAARGEAPKKSVKEGLLDQHSSAKHLPIDNADQFLLQLARELDCFPPAVISNPYQHLLNELKEVNPFPMTEDGGFDIFVTVKKQLQKSQAKHKENNKKEINLTFMKGEYKQVTNLYQDGKYGVCNELTSDEVDLIAWAYIMQGNQPLELKQRQQDEALYREAIEKYKAALKIKPNMHDALYNWGVALDSLTELKQDEAFYHEAIKKYDAALKIKPEMHEALLNLGVVLASLAELKQDETLHRRAIEKYKAALKIKPDKHEALVNWGNALSRLAMMKQDEVLYHDAVEKYEAALKINPDEHGALFNWGTALTNLAELKQDEALYCEAIEKHEAALKIKPDKHEALCNWGDILISLAELRQDEELFREGLKKVEQAHILAPNEEIIVNLRGVIAARIKELFGEDEQE